MITRLRVENYKALRDISLELTPIHALIGPNDSGKTSILNAIASLCRSADYPLQQAFLGAWEGRELVWHGSADGVIRFSAEIASGEEKLSYVLACRFGNSGRSALVEVEKIRLHTELDGGHQNHSNTKVRGVCIDNEKASDELAHACRTVYEALSSVHYYRWIPRHLALPAAPDSRRRFRLNYDGFGLALFLDDILGYDRELFSELERQFCAIFPEIASIKLIRQMAFRAPSDAPEQVSKLEQADGKGLYFELRGNSQLVPAAQASDGVLLILGYLTVLSSPEPPRLLLIEEPENGIHPRRLQEVIQILRDLVKRQSHTQVVLTTHSPYAVDLFSPEEVTLCTKEAGGAVVLTRMGDTKAVQEQHSVFSLGEIWTAEGDSDLAKAQAASAP